ncbi:hypothetical protein NL676_003304 [Syzygium grande]|nr:hypothetical protein NL676_003304 [Syzygium grande]
MGDTWRPVRSISLDRSLRFYFWVQSTSSLVVTYRINGRHPVALACSGFISGGSFSYRETDDNGQIPHVWPRLRMMKMTGLALSTIGMT